MALNDESNDEGLMAEPDADAPGLAGVEAPLLDDGPGDVVALQAPTTSATAADAARSER